MKKSRMKTATIKRLNQSLIGSEKGREKIYCKKRFRWKQGDPGS